MDDLLMIEAIRKLTSPTAVAKRLWCKPSDVRRAYAWWASKRLKQIDDLLLDEIYNMMSEKAWDEVWEVYLANQND